MLIDGNMIISGFVSKVVNDCGDILKSKIRLADENRKCSEQNIETRIYQVIIDAINAFISSKIRNRKSCMMLISWYMFLMVSAKIRNRKSCMIQQKVF